MKQNSARRGFTLIELLVVVLIIGILAAIALPQYNKAVEKSRMADALIQLDAMKKDIDLYLLEQGFPTDYTDLMNQETIDVAPKGEWYKNCNSDGCEASIHASKWSMYICRGDGGPCGAVTGVTKDEWGYLCAHKTDLAKSLCESLSPQGWVTVNYNDL